MNLRWLECSKTEIVASLPFAGGMEESEEWGILVCKSSFSAIDNELLCRFLGFVGPMIRCGIERTRMGLALVEQNASLAANTLLLACALSVLDCSGIEAGDIAVICGTGNFASALLTAAFFQGLRCVQPASCARPRQSSNGCFYIDFNDLRWREVFIDSDHQVRGKITFFEMMGELQPLAEILANLRKRERLVICAIDRPTPHVFNAYRDIHRTSAEVRSWSLIPGTAAFDRFPLVYRRAQNLIKYRKNTHRMRHWLQSLETNMATYRKASN